MAYENLIPIGIFAILIGIALVIVGALLSSKSKTEVGIVGFIGPIPIGFGTSKNILYITIVLAIALLVIFLLLNRRLIF